MPGGIWRRRASRQPRPTLAPPWRSGLLLATALSAFALLLGSLPAFALDSSAAAAADTYVKSGQPNKNQGTETLLRIQDSGNNRALVRFDQAQIAAAVGSGNLTQARLRLNIDFNANNWGTNGRAVAVHRMLQAWTELGATWNCPDDTNTGNGSPDCTPWVMNDSSQYPFLVTPSDVIAHENNQLGPVEWDVTADVQAFLAGAANHGWLVKKADEGEAGKVEYSSREGGVTPELILTIDGTPPPAKPKLLDTFIRQGAPNKSLGSELFLRIKDAGNNRALVAFDQGELEANVGNQTLVSARLRLTIIFNADNWGPSGREVAVHRMLQSWTEVGATWNCADDLNTENTSPDCPAFAWDMTNSAAWPFDPTPTAAIFHVNGQLGEVEWDVTADVQAFLSGTVNYGWLIKKVEEGQAGHVQYSSREGASPPRLVLELSGDEPPVITVTSPADGSFTNTTPITVTGVVNEQATVTVNGQAATVTPGPSGTFLFSRDGVALVEGPNTITVTATDTANNTSTVTITVTLDTSAPADPNPALIDIGDPDANGQVTVTGQNGAVEPGATVTITNTRTGESATVAANANGGFTAQLAGQPGDSYDILVTDPAGNSSNLLQLVHQAPPVLAAIGNRSVSVGQTLSFTVSAFDPNGDPLSFGVTPLPLPANASFNVATREFRFSPVANQVGSFTLTFTVTDGRFADTETIQITVPTPDPNAQASFSGRLLDANDFANGITRPVVGATVSFLGTGLSALSDAQGNFTITGVPAGAQILDIATATANPAPDGSPYGGFREKTTVQANVANVVDRPFFLPRIAVNSLTTINPNATTVVTNPDLGVSITIPPHTAKDANGNDFTGQISISLVPRGLAPAELPEFLDPGQLVTIQPVGVTFATPIPISSLNIDSLTPGSETDIWSLDPDRGIFTIVGIGQVSADGTQITTISGGIRAADWHCISCPPQAGGNGNSAGGGGSGSGAGGTGGNGGGAGSGAGGGDGGPTLGGDGGPKCDGTADPGSSLILRDGCLGTTVLLPPYVSLGQSRSLTFAYKAARAFPQPIIPFEATIPVRAAVPPRLSHQMVIGGVNQGQETFIDTSALAENTDETVRAAVRFDARHLPTGVYPHRIRVTSNYTRTRVSAFINGTTTVVNGESSAFGAGWDLRGLQRLHFNADGSILLAGGDGSASVFRPSGSAAFISPGGDLSTLTQDPGGTYTRRYKDGTRDEFGVDGLQTARVDRNGNTTSYAHDGLDRLISITDPVGLATTFTYAGDFLGAVTDPAGHVTSFAHDGAGNLTQVTFPDGSTRSFGYDERHLMLAETDGRGFTRTREYDATGRLIRAALPDGALRQASNVQSVGLIDAETGLGTAANPAPVVRPNAAVGTFTDGENRSWQVEVSKRGSLTRRTAPTGLTTTIERGSTNDATPQGNTTFAAGQVALAFSFDGSNDTINFNNTLGNFGTADFSVSFWVRTTANRWEGILGKRPVCTHASFWDIRSMPTGQLFVELDQNSAATNYNPIATPRTVNDGVFHHLAIVRVGPTMSIYIDGQLDASGTSPGVTNISNSATLRAGASTCIGVGTPSNSNLPPGVNDFFSGRLDELEIYSRALSASEVQAIFNAGASGIAAPQANLLARYPADGDAADAVGADDLPRRIALPNGAATSTSYDAKGNPLRITDEVLGGTVGLTYEPNFSQVASITDSRNNTTTINHDGAGNPTLITSPLNRTTQAAYDARGLITSLTDVLGTPSSFSYDAAGNVTQITQGTGTEQRVTNLSYTPEGYLASLTDPEGRAFGFSYDPMGRLINQTLPDGRQINLAYDAQGNVSAITPPGRPAHVFNYTAVNLEAEYDPPEVGLPADRTQFAYNLAQQLTRITRPDGKVVDLGYDSGGRLATLAIPRGITTYGYNGTTGNLTSITAPDGGTLSFAYNADLLTSSTWSGSVSGTVARGYDTDRRITSLGVNGDNVAFSYDADGLLSQAGALTVSRDAGSGLISSTGLGSITTARTYNPFGELATETASSGAATPYDVTYTRDKLGRITQKVESVQGQTITTTYGYDLAGRLITVTENGITTTYSYDANGNRLTQVRGTQTTAGSYDDQDRLLSYGSSSYTYTANGELLSKTEGGQTTSYVYDELGNLIQVTLPNGTNIEYLIDGQNRRVGKKVNGTLTQAFLYQDQLNPIAELDGGGNVVSRFVYGTKVNVPDYIVKAGTTYRIVSDHLGSPRLVINATDGTVAQRLDYDEFGNVTADTSPSFQPFGFAGGLYDRDTGLVRFGARDYDAEIGRWTAKDPIRFSGWDRNLYAYVLGDPVNLVDPQGEVAFLPLVIKAIPWVLAGIGAYQVGKALNDQIKQGQKAAEQSQAYADAVERVVKGEQRSFTDELRAADDAFRQQLELATETGKAATDLLYSPITPRLYGPTLPPTGSATRRGVFQCPVPK